MGRLEDSGLGRHTKSKFGDRSILRERSSSFGAKRHTRDLGYHLCSKELQDFERPNGTYTKGFFLDFTIVVLTIGKSSRVQGTRRPQRIRLFLRALVSDRSWFPGNVVEEEMLLSALSHISVGLKRTWDQKRSTGLMGCQMELAVTGYHFDVALD